MQNESDKVGAQFVKTELKLVLLYLDIAAHSFSNGRRNKICKDARGSYETILQALSHLSLTDKEQAVVNAKLHQVRARLEYLAISEPIQEDVRNPG